MSVGAYEVRRAKGAGAEPELSRCGAGAELERSRAEPERRPSVAEVEPKRSRRRSDVISRQVGGLHVKA